MYKYGKQKCLLRIVLISHRSFLQTVAYNIRLKNDIPNIKANFDKLSPNLIHSMLIVFVISNMRRISIINN